jgi:hypothetical protein
MGQWRTSAQAHQLTSQMTRGAIADRGVAQTGGIGLALGDQLANVFDGEIRIDHQDLGQGGHHAHSVEILQGVERQLGVNGRVDGVRAQGEQHGITICRRLSHHIRAHRTASTPLVVDHHRLSQFGLQPCLQDAGNDIGAATRGIGHDKTNGFGGVVVGRRLLRLRADRHSQHEQRQHGAVPKMVAMRFQFDAHLCLL